MHGPPQQGPRGCPAAIIPPVIYLLDGYNLAHWLARGRDMRPEQLRGLLLSRLRGRMPRDASRVRAFWDVRTGVAPDDRRAWIEMVFVPDADEAIVRAVYDAEAPARMIAVSRDREVTGKARQLGARTMSPAELLGR